MDSKAEESFTPSCQLRRNGGRGKCWERNFFFFLAVKRGTCHPCLRSFRVGKAKEGLTYYTYLYIYFWGRKTALCLSRVQQVEREMAFALAVWSSETTPQFTACWEQAQWMVSGRLTRRQRCKRCVHRITYVKKWKKNMFSVWRKYIKSVYLQGPWWCRLLWSYTHPLMIWILGD